MTDLTGKYALVLGGSRGIGADTAVTLARRGADVALTFAQSKDRADTVVADIERHGRRGLAIQADAGTRGATAKAVERTVAAFGRIDILVSTAGVFDTGPIEEIDDARFDRSFDLHVRSVVEDVRTALPDMPEGGTIVTFGSIFGEMAPFPGLTLYTASKAAESGLAKALARELGPRGITVNAVQPGPIDTEMNPGDPDKNPTATTQIGNTALGRYGKTSEIAGLVAFLASADGRYLTGQTLNVDGGWTA